MHNDDFLGETFHFISFHFFFGGGGGIFWSIGSIFWILVIYCHLNNNDNNKAYILLKTNVYELPHI